MGRSLAKLGRRMAIGAVLIVSGCSSTSPSATPPSASPPVVTVVPTPAPSATASLAAIPASTPAASPSPIPTPVPTPSDSPPRPLTASAWKEVPSQASVRGVQLLDVVWTGTRFIAVGSDAVLDSTDGVRWHRQKSRWTGGDAHLAAGPVGVVAVDATGSWTSRDGLSWVAHPKAFRVANIGSDSVDVTDVVATSGGWIAVGSQDPPCSFDCRDHTRALVWTSDDGAHWTRVPDQKAFAGGGMETVARTTNGFIAAGGGASNAAIWTSPDGQAWSRVPDSKMFHGPDGSSLDATGVSVRGTDIAVVGLVGYSDPPSARAWWSSDGETWSKAPVEKGKSGQMFSVAATIDGFLAAGPSGGDSCLGGIWASTDGHAWRCDAPQRRFAGFGPYAIAASDTVEVAVGLSDGGDDAPPDGAIFSRTWN